MEEKKNRYEIRDIESKDDSVERLKPGLSEVLDSLDETAQEDPIDSLFKEETSNIEQDLDGLFDEKREEARSKLQEEVDRALSQKEMSRASLYRMRLNDPTEEALKEKKAQHKTVEEIWEESDLDHESKNKGSIYLMSIVALLAIIAGSWALWEASHDERGDEEHILASEKKSKQEELDRIALSIEVNDVSLLIDGYLSAKTVEQKLKYIYKADEFGELIKAYYADQDEFVPYGEYYVKSSISNTFDGVEFWQVITERDFNGIIRNELLYIRKNSLGEYKLDWKASIGFQDFDILKFKNSRSTEAVSFKFQVVMLEEMGVYNWGYNDIEHQAFRLSSPDGNYVFWGYVKINSQLHQGLLRIIKLMRYRSMTNNTEFTRLTLRVRFLEDSPMENDQFIFIEELVSSTWMNPTE